MGWDCEVAPEYLLGSPYAAGRLNITYGGELGFQPIIWYYPTFYPREGNAGVASMR